MNKLATVLVLAASLAGAVRAQDKLSGTWEGETRNGASIVLTLTVKGSVLTGTLVRDGQSAALADGKTSNSSFTCKATLNDQTMEFAGELAGDEIKIWIERQGPSSAIVLRRAQRK